MSPAAPAPVVSLAQFSAGGIIDDIDVNILDAVFIQYDYQGNIDHEILALGIQYQDDNGKTYDQYYSAGELSYFIPSDDARSIVPVGDKSMLAETSNAAKFLASLMEAGVDPEVLGAGSLEPLIGMRVHVKQHAQPKRQGLIRGGKNADREPTVLLVTQILAYPGEKPAAPVPAKKAAVGGVAGAGKPLGKPAAPAQPAKPGLGKPAPTKAAPAATTGARATAKSATSPSKVNGQAAAATTAAGDDDKAVAADVLMGILMEREGNAISKKELAPAAFRTLTAKVAGGEIDAKQKTKLTQLIFMDSFLHELAEQGGITYDGNTVAMAA